MCADETRLVACVVAEAQCSVGKGFVVECKSETIHVSHLPFALDNNGVRVTIDHPVEKRQCVCVGEEQGA